MGDLPKLFECGTCGRLSPDPKFCRDCREAVQSRNFRGELRSLFEPHDPPLRGEYTRPLKATRHF